MRKISAVLTSSLLAFASAVSFALPASAADTVGVYLETVQGVNLNYTGPTFIQASGSKLFFSQLGSLYAYDSTLNTTVSLLPNGAALEHPQYALAAGKLVFGADLNNGYGSELYISDGTIAGTTLLKDIVPGAVSSTSRFFMQFGTKAVFVIYTTQYELWITDGTSSGTTKITNLGMIGVGSSAVLNGRLYFEAAAPPSNGPLTVWSTDGVTAQQVSAITPNDSHLTTFGDWVYFNGDSTSAAISNRGSGVTGWELLRTNGTVTEIAADINPTTNNASWSKPTQMAVFNGALYFSAQDGIHGYELMKFDGATVSLVKDEYLGAGSSSPWNLKAFNGKLYYSAVDSINSRELYSSDGTSAGSGLLAEIYPGSVVCAPMDWSCYAGANNGDPRFFTEYDGKLVFSSVNATVGGELFAITPPVVTPQVVAPVVQPAARHVYQGPLFNPIEARRFDATVGGKVVVTGKRLESVTQILLDGKAVEITASTGSQIEFIAPAATAGSPELTIKFGSGVLTWVNALTYFDPDAEKAAFENRQPKPQKASKPTKASKPKKPKR